LSSQTIVRAQGHEECHVGSRYIGGRYKSIVDSSSDRRGEDFEPIGFGDIAICYWDILVGCAGIDCQSIVLAVGLRDDLPSITVVCTHLSHVDRTHHVDIALVGSQGKLSGFDNPILACCPCETILDQIGILLSEHLACDPHFFPAKVGELFRLNIVVLETLDKLQAFIGRCPVGNFGQGILDALERATGRVSSTVPSVNLNLIDSETRRRVPTDGRDLT
jgi:hypothetical protein